MPKRQEPQFTLDELGQLQKYRHHLDAFDISEGYKDILLVERMRIVQTIVDSAFIPAPRKHALSESGLRMLKRRSEPREFDRKDVMQLRLYFELNILDIASLGQPITFKG